MHYQEIKVKLLEESLDKLCTISTEKFGLLWSINPSFYSSRERVLMERYLLELQTINETPHQVTDNICLE